MKLCEGVVRRADFSNCHAWHRTRCHAHLANPMRRTGGDIHDLLKLHIDSRGRLSDLIQLSVKQRGAGDLEISRETFQHAEHVRLGCTGTKSPQTVSAWERKASG